MKLTIERDAAVTAVGKVQGAVLSRNTIPILADVLVQASDGEVWVTATDQAVEISARAIAEVEAPGAVAVPAGRLHDILRSLPGGAQVSLELPKGEHRLTVRCGRSRFQLPTLPAAEFPVMPGGGGEHQATVGPKALAKLLEKTGFCMSKETTRYYLNGLNLHTVADGAGMRLRAVATDGGRLGWAEVACPEGWEKAPSILLPSKTVAELRRVLDGESDDVALSFDGKRIRVEGEGWLLTSVLNDGNFPDYGRVIPRDASRRVEADVTELMAGLKRCALMTGDKTRMVRLSLEPGAVTLRARDSTGDGGEAEERVEVDFDGEPAELSFNSGYLVDIASAMSGERIVVELGGPNDPAKLLDPRDADVLYVCMPLRA